MASKQTVFSPEHTFYTHVTRASNNLFVVGYNTVTGKKINEKIAFEPELFFPTTSQSTPFSTITGQPLQKRSFENMSDAHKAIANSTAMATAGTPCVFGQNRWVYQWIANNWGSLPVKYDASLIRVAMLDIETTTKYGFPDSKNPMEQIVVITIKCGKKLKVFGLHPWKQDNARCDLPPVDYVECHDEHDLLEKFINFIIELAPDIITGWNTSYFDLPYIYNRIVKIFGDGNIEKGEEIANNLSPLNKCEVVECFVNNRPAVKLVIDGIHTIDYLDLYKKFELTPRADYKLETIVEIELGKHKLDAGFNTYDEWYRNGWTSYVDYNIVDVLLIDELDAAKKFLQLSYELVYGSYCMPGDVTSPIRLWDQIIWTTMIKNNVVIWISNNADRDAEEYEGGFVVQTIPGKYGHIMSFDVASEYPHVMSQFSISPENLEPVSEIDAKNILEACLKEYPHDVRTVMGQKFIEENDKAVLTEQTICKETIIAALIDGKFDCAPLKQANVTMAPSGILFKKQPGFLGKSVISYYYQRKALNERIKIIEQDIVPALEAHLKSFN